MNTLARLELFAREPSHGRVLHAQLCAAPGRGGCRSPDRHRRSLPVRTLILAGEPGGSIPAVRRRIEEAWQARVFDHAGATEVGPWGFADSEPPGLHVMESQFIAEFLSVETGARRAKANSAELVLTTLGRAGCPVIRYRTGDLVRPIWHAIAPNRFRAARGRRARAGRRHADHSRRECLSQLASSKSCAAFPKCSNTALTALQGGRDGPADRRSRRSS